MIVYRTNYTRNSPFLGQIVPETIFTLIFHNFSFFHSFSGNRKLPQKPLRKLGKHRFFSFFSPVIVLLEGKQTERGEKSLRLKIGGEND